MHAFITVVSLFLILIIFVTILVMAQKATTEFDHVDDYNIVTLW